MFCGKQHYRKGISINFAIAKSFVLVLVALRVNFFNKSFSYLLHTPTLYFIQFNYISNMLGNISNFPSVNNWYHSKCL